MRRIPGSRTGRLGDHSGSSSPLRRRGRSAATSLDVGCGTGENVLFLAERGHTVWEWIQCRGRSSLPGKRRGNAIFPSRSWCRTPSIWKTSAGPSIPSSTPACSTPSLRPRSPALCPESRRCLAAGRDLPHARPQISRTRRKRAPPGHAAGDTGDVRRRMADQLDPSRGLRGAGETGRVPGLAVIDHPCLTLPVIRPVLPALPGDPPPGHCISRPRSSYY